MYARKHFINVRPVEADSLYGVYRTSVRSVVGRRFCWRKMCREYFANGIFSGLNFFPYESL